MRKPDMRKSDMMNPDMMKPEMKKPEMMKPMLRKPGDEIDVGQLQSLGRMSSYRTSAEKKT